MDYITVTRKTSQTMLLRVRQINFLKFDFRFYFVLQLT